MPMQQFESLCFVGTLPTMEKEFFKVLAKMRRGITKKTKKKMEEKEEKQISMFRKDDV